jgi:hypothetical protein
LFFLITVRKDSTKKTRTTTSKKSSVGEDVGENNPFVLLRM